MMMMMKYCSTSTLLFLLLFPSIPFPRNAVVVVDARVVRKARLTLVSFATVWEEDGGWVSRGCDSGAVVGDKEKVVALSSSWFDKGRRCNKYVRITGGDSGRTVTARVVGECDASLGCDGDVIDASRAVWMGLKVGSRDWGRRRLYVSWYDA
ncbi:unnamed protein product [Linum trigynum]|uniref:Uncharacterized protein n=1 Tax=Linum trigynum TaxID=586398 RepID=A0AAV2D200_9ROSI